ncbi:hypothetical protein [Pseudomonas sp. RIT-PI-AD]|uniref:hypothetical protein n=1 Tax=Pseudomonas sp. RIT-PI-AD TaxID=3035294 RepID=UPI0021D83B4F|nr:hypothetical protein [Pseudomonas sp. RIT-PI-AD]
MGNTDTLAKLATSLLEKQEPFKVGDLINWKEGLKNRMSKGPLVVTAVLSQVVFDGEMNSGKPEFREPLDIKAATLGSDGELIEYHFDSRRFRLA